MAKDNLVKIGGELKSVAADGVVAGAEAIHDYTEGKSQATINQDLKKAIKDIDVTEQISGKLDKTEAAELYQPKGNYLTEHQDISGKADKATTLAGYGINDAYTKSETYTKNEVNGLVDTPHQEYVTVEAYASLPATGSKDTIYRVSNYNGSTSQTDASVYSEYAWDGNQYIFLCVKSQIGEVFDISVYNNNTKYANLAAALNGGANIPQSLQKGGMSVKFVQSSDNKYVQYRLMADTFNTSVANWQGVDDEPTAGSENLVKSGGAERKIRAEIDNYNKVEGKVFYITDGDKNIIAKVDKDGVHSVDFRYGQEDTSLVDAVEHEVEAREEGDATITALVEAEEARAKDAENTKLNHTIENDIFLITDSHGFIIAKVDNKGIHAPNMFEGKFDDDKLLIMDNNGYIIVKVDKDGVHSAKDKHAVTCMVLSEAYYPTSAPVRDSEGYVTYAEVMFETGVEGSISITYTNGNSSSVVVVYGNYNYTITINRDADGNVETVSVN